MKKSKTCAKCSSENVHHAKKLYTKGYNCLKALEPTFAGRQKGIFEAYICRDCGYAELYVVDPEYLTIEEKAD